MHSDDARPGADRPQDGPDGDHAPLLDGSGAGTHDEGPADSPYGDHAPLLDGGGADDPALEAELEALAARHTLGWTGVGHAVIAKIVFGAVFLHVVAPIGGIDAAPQLVAEYAAIAAATVWWVRWCRIDGRARLGLRAPRRWIALTLLGPLAVLAVNAALGHATGAHTAAPTPGLRLLALLGAPVFEELWDRGVLWASLEAAHGTRLAAVVTSLWFVTSHEGWLGPAGLQLTLLAALLAALRIRTGSLWPCMLAHALYNGVIEALTQLG